MQSSSIRIERENAWSNPLVSVSIGNHVAKCVCKSEDAISRFVGGQMRLAMEKYISMRVRAYRSVDKLSQERISRIQLIQYRLSSRGVWDARKASAIFLRSAGDLQMLLPPQRSRLRKSSEQLFNDLAECARFITTRL